EGDEPRDGASAVPLVRAGVRTVADPREHAVAHGERQGVIRVALAEEVTPACGFHASTLPDRRGVALRPVDDPLPRTPNPNKDTKLGVLRRAWCPRSEAEAEAFRTAEPLRQVPRQPAVAVARRIVH